MKLNENDPSAVSQCMKSPEQVNETERTVVVTWDDAACLVTIVRKARSSKNQIGKEHFYHQRKMTNYGASSSPNT